ncbi:peptidase M23 [Maribacter algarum]|uniref:Peptidase M23 n=1 Tax=Maribacter algarum (ex Zhang et al. 2020) TaxID=2578118 RepID=A0A5S3PGQ6_9FLAO|nr:peptidoglycan DD-metalloendopeptidase family protein [Maribacter algarum]TMM53313.1 peptidase M23 [Maribacter algarum]
MISSLTELFENLESPIYLLDSLITLDSFCPIDLSVYNNELDNIDITNPDKCQEYIDTVLAKNKAKVGYGGYLEKRNLYSDKSSFSDQTAYRNIHLGVDFWTTAGTKVITPLKGNVHSFKNNNVFGDYGPTIILQHEIRGFRFHTLYGHLSIESIETIQIGQEFEKGSVLATLGTPDINVNYAPHLHFQIIIDMEGMKGDYPGVCSVDKLKFYAQNCPDPNILLNF